MASNYNIVASTNELTVVAEYTPEQRAEGQKYQSEAAEKAFIEQLESQGYEYFKIKDEASFIKPENSVGKAQQLQLFRK